VSASPADPVLYFAGVSRTFPGWPPVPALRSCDLVIERGEYVTVAGPSGSGKSTFLNLAGLLDRPTGGRYFLDGLDVSGLSERHRAALRGRRIGFVFQEFHLLPQRTAMDNVMLAQLYTQGGRAARRMQAASVLERVGLAHRAWHLVSKMSGGERQRVAIARALVNSPSFLICDEPTGNLDTSTAGAVLEVIAQLHSAGLTIILATHDVSVAAGAQRRLLVRDGVLSEAASADLAQAVAQSAPGDNSGELQ
jgi:putative ABC transport system ATP-binding protein